MMGTVDIDDTVVTGKVLAILGELHAHPQDPAPQIWDNGPHRLYEWCVLCRDDMPLREQDVRAYLSVVNVVGRAKPGLYEIKSYGTHRPNLTRYYLRVYI